MNKYKSFFIFIILILFIVNTFGWSRHNLISRIILSQVDWLSEYKEIEVTPYTYNDETINPNFVIYFEPPLDKTADFPPDGSFFDYYKDNGYFYGYKGKKIGEKTSALEILCDYSDEPDWEMDTEMHHHFNQKFMGGSQGYRHMYYPFGYFKVANVIFPQGKTPERVDFYFKNAEEAFNKKDLYWGFRFLARCLHSLEDISNPYHAKQTSGKFIHWNDPVGSTTTVTKNYHAVWEVYFGNAMTFEYLGKTSKFPLIDYLKQGKIEVVKSPKALTKKASRESALLAKESFKTSIAFFGTKYDILEEIFMEEDEFLKRYDSKGEELEKQEAIHKVCSEAYLNMSTTILSFMEYSRKRFNL